MNENIFTLLKKIEEKNMTTIWIEVFSDGSGNICTFEEETSFISFNDCERILEDMLEELI